MEIPAEMAREEFEAFVDLPMSQQNTVSLMVSNPRIIYQASSSLILAVMRIKMTSKI